MTRRPCRPPAAPAAPCRARSRPGQPPAPASSNDRRRRAGRRAIAPARIFPLDRARGGYISLKTLIDRSFGAARAAPGTKPDAT